MRVPKTGSRRIEFKTKTDEQKMLYEQKKEELGFVLSLMSDLSAALILGKMGPLRDIKFPQKCGCQVLTTRFSFPDIANG